MVGMVSCQADSLSLHGEKEQEAPPQILRRHLSAIILAWATLFCNIA